MGGAVDDYLRRHFAGLFAPNPDMPIRPGDEDFLHYAERIEELRLLLLGLIVHIEAIEARQQND